MKFLKKLFSYINPSIKRYYPYLFASFLFYISAMILSSAFIPVLYQKIIDSLTSAHVEQESLYILVYVVIALIATSQLFDFLTDYFYFKKVRPQVRTKLNKKIFSDLINKDYHFYLDNFSGSLVAKFSKFPVAVLRLYEILAYGIVTNFGAILAMFVILALKSWSLVFIFAAWSALYIAVSYFWARKRAVTSLEKTKQYSKLTGHLSDALSNIAQVKSFGKEEFEEGHFDLENSKMEKAFHKDMDTIIGTQATSNSLSVLFQSGIIIFSIYLWQQGIISAGYIVLLFMYFRSLKGYIRTLGRSLPSFSEGIADTEEILDIVNEPISIKDEGTQTYTKQKNTDLIFKDLSFTYPNGEAIFDHFNLEIPQGQKVGVVGKSGSGKTSLAKLLLRFYDPQDGAIFIGGKDIRDFSQASYRKEALAFVPQETNLFHRSLRENIIYGTENVSDELFHHVVQSSYVDEFAENFEEKYETQVGERGVRLSGGQRQRIGIARAMLKKDAPILIMDEATSALDSQSEAFIQKSFEELSRGRTTLVIAHRLSTIQKMDRILVMEKGKIIEDGSHDELLAQNGHYARLWNSQVGGFLVEE